MDEFIRCDEILSWMIETWMKNSLRKWQQSQHCKTHKPPQQSKGMTNNVGLTFSIGDTILRFTISIEQDN